MEAEARDSEEETANDVAKRKSLDQTANRQTPSLHNRPSSSLTHNPLTESPAPRQSGNPESKGKKQIPATTQSKDMGSKTIVNVPIKSPLHSGPTMSVTPNLPTKSPAPGLVNSSNSSSSIQVAKSGTDIGLEKMINSAIKSPSLHGGSTTSAGPTPVKSHAVTPLKNPDIGRHTKNPALTTPEVLLSIKAPSLQCPPASSIDLDPPVKCPALGPFDNQGARDHPVIMLHEESRFKKLNLHVKSPFTTGNHTPTAASGLPSQNSNLREKSVAPSSSRDPGNLDKMTQMDSRSEKMVNLPIEKSPLVTFNHTLDASTRQLQDADFRGEKDNLGRTPVEETKSGELANSNVKSPPVIEARDQIMVQTPFQCISSGKGISLTKVSQSKIEGNSCINPQNEVGHDKGYRTRTAKSAAPSLSENKEIASSELVGSTNLVITCNSTTSPQIGIGSKRGLSVPCESPLETLKCQNVSSSGEHGSCAARLPVLTNSATTKKSYTRKLRKKSASPEEQQSDPSVNTTTPKVILGISPPGLGDRNGETNRDAEIEKSVEQSCACLPQKRKASGDSIHISPFVANEFDALERINLLPKERDAVTDEQVQRGISNGTSDDAAKVISKTSRIKRTSLKCAKPPRCSPSNSNNIRPSEAADKVQVEEKVELLNGKQPNGPDFSSYFGSSTEKIGITTSIFVAEDGDNEMRPALNQSRKAEAENKILEIKGLSPDSIEAELNKHPSDASYDPSNNQKHSAGARIKKAIAKRSMKGKLQNPNINGYLKAVNNSGAKPDSSNNTMNDGTKDKWEASDAGPKDADSGIVREVSNSCVNPEIVNKASENGISDKAETPDVRLKSVRTNVSRKLGMTNGAALETNKKRSIQKDRMREKMTNGSKSTSNKSNITMDWLLTSTELDPEKENRPGPAEPSTADSESVLKCKKKQVPTQKECTGGDHKLVHAGMAPMTCFILSGHRLQRKEFQAVIKKLRGRVCRDTHNWSFQATHFIVPGPVRRTEKFFAAAASGRYKFPYYSYYSFLNICEIPVQTSCMNLNYFSFL